jgi:iron complex outermembrane receptor protein
MAGVMFKLLGGISAVVAGLAGLAVNAQAADDIHDAETVIVTGTRVAGYTEDTSPSPISVYDNGELANTGFTDLGQALEAVSPSINFPHSATTPSAASTRAITMRGMSPDQVLVLVNGKRWQTSSVLDFNNSVGRGSAPYDLGAIPQSAVDHVEVLSDSAAAQYGSDAIAGVVNIILKSSDSGGVASGQAGITDRGDGADFDLSASQGFALGDHGHLTLSGDLRHQDITNRAAIDPRFGRVTGQIGDPRALDLGLAADAGYSIDADWEAYGSLIFSRRDSQSGAQYRTPAIAPTLYPNGFVPQINPLLWDVTAIGGVRGELGGGYHLDVSNSLGFNDAHFDVKNTANAALGAASPTAFYAGSEQYWQDDVSATVSHDLDGVLAGGNAAAGLEFRDENYSIADGSPQSSQQGGAQGFPGFSPRLPVDESRTAVSAFADVTIDPVRWLIADVAGRFDHYSDFGDALTWKTNLRANLTDWLALRGAAGSGFRAPALQQQYFSSVVSQINPSGTIVHTGTYQVNDPIARALGSSPLKPEQSHNYTAGVVLTPIRGFSFSGDWYEIDVHNRIALSDTLTGAAVSAVLAAAGASDVQQAQFFTNAAQTRTQGYELSANYTAGVWENAFLEARVQYGQYRTHLISLAANPAIPSLPLLGTTSRALLTTAQPTDKLTSSLTLNWEPVSATVSVDHYGPWTAAPIGVVQNFSSKTLLDLAAGYDITDAVQLSAGIDNVTDQYPDLLVGAAVTGMGFTYGEESPFGVNGRTYFVRLSLKM